MTSATSILQRVTKLPSHSIKFDPLLPLKRHPINLLINTTPSKLSNLTGNYNQRQLSQWKITPLFWNYFPVAVSGLVPVPNFSNNSSSDDQVDCMVCVSEELLNLKNDLIEQIMSIGEIKLCILNPVSLENANVKSNIETVGKWGWQRQEWQKGLLLHP
ncbi:hypothetical protein DAMA08_002040 [Martiniozyma asiatica (nom. inval.)]|nr:hypothetical protein DAMA08_002040 [Martiniozyma asiatica]